MGVVFRVDKHKLERKFQTMGGDVLIARFAAEVVSQLPKHTLNKATLLIDGNRDEAALARKLRVTISERLRGGAVYLKRTAMRPACEEDGLQVADMLAGAAASEHLEENALLGYLGDKVQLTDYTGG